MHYKLINYSDSFAIVSVSGNVVYQDGSPCAEVHITYDRTPYNDTCDIIENRGFCAISHKPSIKLVPGEHIIHNGIGFDDCNVTLVHASAILRKWHTKRVGQYISVHNNVSNTPVVSGLTSSADAELIVTALNEYDIQHVDDTDNYTHINSYDLAMSINVKKMLKKLQRYAHKLPLSSPDARFMHKLKQLTIKN